MSRIELDALPREEREALRERVSLADFTSLDRLVAICGSCRRGRIMHPSKLKRRFGQRRIVYLEQKLICDACGNRRGNRFFWAEEESR